MVRDNTESMLTTITIQKGINHTDWAFIFDQFVAQILQATAMKGATISMRQISE